MRKLAGLFFVAMGVAACSTTSAGGTDGGDDSGTQDASTQDSSTPQDGSNSNSDGSGDSSIQCALGTAPASLPQVTSSFVFGVPSAPDGGDAGGDAGDGGAGDGGDAGCAGTPSPSATGGDPTGTWVFTNITVYLDPALNGLVTGSTSNATGTGWIRFNGTSFAQYSNIVVTAQTLLGAQSTPIKTQATGTFLTCGPELGLNTTCTSNASALATTTFSFSRETSTTMQLILRSPAPTGAPAGTKDVFTVIDMKPGT